MRSINSIQEAQREINELQNRIDTICGKNWDRRKTRIVNAHPSVDPYDYVVRKELDAIRGGGTNTTALGGYDKCTFGIAIDSDLYVANDTNPWFIVPATLKLVWLAGVIKNPADATVSFRINKNPADPQNPQTDELIIAPGLTASTLVHTWNTFSITNFNAKDIITIDTTSIGSTIAGGDVVFVLKFEIVDNNVGTIDHYYLP